MNKKRLLKSVLIVAGLLGGLFGLMFFLVELDNRFPDIIPRVVAVAAVLFVVAAFVNMVYEALEINDKAKRR